MPIGALNEAPTFVEIMMKPKNEFNTLAKERRLKMSHKNIADDVLLYGRTVKQILTYFKTLLNVLKHHHATLKLKRCKWFQDRYKFVGMYIAAVGTQPAQSKNQAFEKIERPNTWRDLRMLIGVFGFYNPFLPLYNLYIRPWRYILLNHPQPGTPPQKD